MKYLLGVIHRGLFPLIFFLILQLFAGNGLADDVDDILVNQWHITTGTAKKELVKPGIFYGLKNTPTGQSVKYGKRKYGINLVWDSKNKGKNIGFKRSSKAKGALKYGELIAINVKGRGYLHYKKRKNGINLVWSKKPVYEWKIGRGHSKGPVRTSVMVSFHNKIENDYLVYCKRNRGINLRWLKDKVGKGCKYWHEKLRTAIEKAIWEAGKEAGEAALANALKGP